MFFYLLVALMASQIAAIIDGVRIKLAREDGTPIEHWQSQLARISVVLAGLFAFYWTDLQLGWGIVLTLIASLCSGMALLSMTFRLTLNKMIDVDSLYIGNSSWYDIKLHWIANSKFGKRVGIEAGEFAFSIEFFFCVTFGMVVWSISYFGI